MKDTWDKNVEWNLDMAAAIPTEPENKADECYGKNTFYISKL